VKLHWVRAVFFSTGLGALAWHLLGWKGLLVGVLGTGWGIVHGVTLERHFDELASRRLVRQLERNRRSSS
jgi:hypothetical protein